MRRWRPLQQRRIVPRIASSSTTTPAARTGRSAPEWYECERERRETGRERLPGARLALEQRPLAREAPAVAGRLAVLADGAVARDRDGQPVRGARRPDGLRRTRGAG